MKLNFGDNLVYILRDHQYKYKGKLSSEANRVTSFKGYQLFDLDKYMPNNPQQIEQFVIKNLDWKRPERSWHYDCLVEEMKDVFYYGLLGYTESDFKVKCNGSPQAITKEEATRQIEIMRTLVQIVFPKRKSFCPIRIKAFNWKNAGSNHKPIFNII